MSILHSLVLGILQGISEFFPISSSAHLTLFPWLLGWDDFGNDESLRRAFDVALHLGTALALLIHMRTEIFELIKGVGSGARKEAESGARKEAGSGTKKSWDFIFKVVVATIPAVLIGVFFFSDADTETIWLIATLLIGFGVLLGVVDMLAPAQKTLENFSFKDAVFFGLVQAGALWPGVSRSGIIMTASRARGFNRSTAVGISFWMALPILFGAALYKFIDIGGVSGIPSNMRPAFLIGMLTSALVGFFALKGLTRLVLKISLTPLVAERVALGVLALILLQTSFR